MRSLLNSGLARCGGLLVILTGCRGEARPSPQVGPTPAASAAAPAAAGNDAILTGPDALGPPSADSGFSVESVRAHGNEGRFQVYFLSSDAVLWVSVRLGEADGARFDAARLRVEQIAELVVGERARNVLPSGPARPPPEARDRHAATAGTVYVARSGDDQVRASVRGLVFAGRPPISLAPRTIRLSVPPP